MIAAGNDRLFRALCAALGLPSSRPIRASRLTRRRSANRNELLPPLAQRLAQETSATWLERLRAAGVPVAPVRLGRGRRRAPPDRSGGDPAGARRPQRPSRRRCYSTADGPQHAAPPPRLGEHSLEILAEAGYDEPEVAELVQQGVVGAD